MFPLTLWGYWRFVFSDSSDLTNSIRNEIIDLLIIQIIRNNSLLASLLLGEGMWRNPLLIASSPSVVRSGKIHHSGYSKALTSSVICKLTWSTQTPSEVFMHAVFFLLAATRKAFSFNPAAFEEVTQTSSWPLKVRVNIVS